MSGEFYLIRSERDVEHVMPNIVRRLGDWDWSDYCQIQVKKWVPPRTLSQNALFHVWMRHMAAHFTMRGTEVDEEEMKTLMVHKFLGTEDITINRTTIPAQLRRTSKLDKGEMQWFMDQVSAWAMDMGITLDAPAESEYMKLKREEVA